MAVFWFSATCTVCFSWKKQLNTFFFCRIFRRFALCILFYNFLHIFHYYFTFGTGILIRGALVAFSCSFYCLSPWSGYDSPNDPQQSYCSHLNSHCIVQPKSINNFITHSKEGYIWLWFCVSRISPLVLIYSFCVRQKTVNKNKVGPVLCPTKCSTERSSSD